MKEKYNYICENISELTSLYGLQVESYKQERNRIVLKLKSNSESTSFATQMIYNPEVNSSKVNEDRINVVYEILS